MPNTVCDVLRFVPGCPVPYSNRQWITSLMMGHHLPVGPAIRMEYMCYDPDWSDDNRYQAIINTIVDYHGQVVAIDLVNLDRAIAELVAINECASGFMVFATQIDPETGEVLKIEKLVKREPVEWEDLGSPTRGFAVVGGYFPEAPCTVRVSAESDDDNKKGGGG